MAEPVIVPGGAFDRSRIRNLAERLLRTAVAAFLAAFIAALAGKFNDANAVESWSVLWTLLVSAGAGALTAAVNAVVIAAQKLLPMPDPT